MALKIQVALEINVIDIHTYSLHILPGLWGIWEFKKKPH